MIGIQPDSVFHAAVIKPTQALARGISNRRLSLAKQGSSFGFSSGRIRWQSQDEEYEYPSAASQASFEDLWYTLEELEKAVKDEVDAILKGKHQEGEEEKFRQCDTQKLVGETTTRGLEFFLNSDQKHRSQTIQRYIQTMVKKTHEHAKLSPKTLIQTHGKHAYAYHHDESSVIRYSHQATGIAKKRARRAARKDELDAKRLYREEGEEEKVLASSFEVHSTPTKGLDTGKENYDTQITHKEA